MNSAPILSIVIFSGLALIICWWVLRRHKYKEKLSDLLQEKLRQDLLQNNTSYGKTSPQSFHHNEPKASESIIDSTRLFFRQAQKPPEDSSKSSATWNYHKVNIFADNPRPIAEDKATQEIISLTRPQKPHTNPEGNEKIKPTEVVRLIKVQDLADDSSQEGLAQESRAMPLHKIKHLETDTKLVVVRGTKSAEYESSLPQKKIPELSEDTLQKSNLETQTFTIVHPYSLDIPRNEAVSQLMRLMQVYPLIYLYGASGSGKASLVSLLARELRLSALGSVYAFRFSIECTQLEEGLRYILSQQLKLKKEQITNSIQSFYRICQEDALTFILYNAQLLSPTDQLLLLSVDPSPSKVILIGESPPKESDQRPFTYIMESPPLSNDAIKYCLQERSCLPIRFNPVLSNRLYRFLKGSPFALKLLVAYTDLLKDSGLSFEELLNQVVELKTPSKRNIPVQIGNLLSLVIERLSQPLRDILLLTAFLPLHSFTPELLKQITQLDEAPALLDKLFHYGLLLRLSDEKENSVLYAPPELVKIHLYAHYCQQPDLVQKVQNGLLAYLIAKLSDREELAQLDPRFLSSALIYTITHNQLASNLRYAHFQEEVLLYLAETAFADKVESLLIPLYRETLESVLSNQEKAHWQKLLGMGLMLIAENKPQSSDKQNLLQEALDKLQASLQIYLGSGDCAVQRQSVYNLLGQIYLRLSEQEESPELLLKGIENLKSSIQMPEASRQPENLIQSYLQLGGCYIKLYRQKGDLICLSLAIEILRHISKAHPKHWTKLQRFELHCNIGNALYNLAAHENPLSNLQATIKEYKAAEENAVLATERALIQNCLGCTHWRLAKYHNPIFHLESAIAAYKKCLELISLNQKLKNTATLEQAVLLNNLGNAYRTLASQKRNHDYLSLSIHSFREALRIAQKLENQKLVETIGKHLFELSNQVDQSLLANPLKPAN
ncbi:MAG: hypothetical protein SFT81_01505 [Candidatus Caenarcaniphilales bacterium]|nr:hypothetical protein [Candidatus Caenarcaniphilales bacterium]